MNRINLRLLGPFRLETGEGNSITVKAKKAQALIAYLAVRTGRPVPRAYLAELLWPDSDAEVARANLRQMLTQIRSDAPQISAALHTPDRDHLSFDESECEVDVLEFERGASKDPAKAVSLYSGQFLEGHQADWIDTKRAELSETYLKSIEDLADTSEPGERIGLLRTAVEQEPFRELLVQKLLIALVQSGDSARARLVYRRFEDLLRRELHSEPSPDTKRLLDVPALTLETGSAAVPKRSNNLPIQLTSFIGREEEIDEIKNLLAKNRLLTLFGSGGSGKTRLALQASARLIEEFPDGVWLIELASIVEATQTFAAVFSVLSLKEQPGRSFAEILVGALQGKEMLILLDNCEHLLAGCFVLADLLLRNCPKVKVLATSREALDVPGEVIYHVPSLLESEANRLFVDRASSQLPGFTASGENSLVIASLCRRLDGIPLAIELAAAHVRSLSVQEIEARLDKRFHLLMRGSKTLLPRQQTLRALIDWSYNLLQPKERLLLCRLSIFAGSWTLAATESVCAGSWTLAATESVCAGEAAAGLTIEPGEILDLLTGLVHKSLVSAEPINGESHYGMLETVRQYGAERLGDFEDGVALGRRHRDFYLSMAEDAAPKLSGYREMKLFSVLERAHDNLRQAVSTCLSQSDGREDGFRFVAALWLFWFVQGHVSEGREAFETLESSREGEVGEKVLADASFGAGWLALRQADYPVARSLFELCLTTRKKAGDKPGIANSLHGLGQVAIQMGEYDVAELALTESLSIRSEHADKWGIGACLDCLGHIAFWREDYPKAKTLFEQSLEIKREANNRQSICMSLIALAKIATEQVEFSRARALLAESATMQRELAVDWLVVNTLEAFAYLAFKEGDLEQAVRLWGAASAQRGEVGYAIPVNQRDRFAANVASVRSALGDEAFSAIWEEGRAMSADHAIDRALGR